MDSVSDDASLVSTSTQPADVPKIKADEGSNAHNTTMTSYSIDALLGLRPGKCASSGVSKRTRDVIKEEECDGGKSLQILHLAFFCHLFFACTVIFYACMYMHMHIKLYIPIRVHVRTGTCTYYSLTHLK